jgi:hypothetical protein
MINDCEICEYLYGDEAALLAKVTLKDVATAYARGVVRGYSESRRPLLFCVHHRDIFTSVVKSFADLKDRE